MRIHLWKVFVFTCAVLLILWLDHNDKQELKTENSGLQEVIVPNTTIIKSESGETFATQPKAEVSEETFGNLMDENLKGYQKKTDGHLKPSEVRSIVEAVLKTKHDLNLKGKDTVMVWKHDTVTVIDTVKYFHWKNTFGSGAIMVKGNEARMTDSTVNRVALLETKDRWRAKHLFPWNWGTRKKRINLLVFNPDTRVDTLSNLSVIKK